MSPSYHLEMYMYTGMNLDEHQQKKVSWNCASKVMPHLHLAKQDNTNSTLCIQHKQGEIPSITWDTDDDVLPTDIYHTF
jgi:hypothetical protein